MSEKVAVRNVRLCEKDCLCLYVCPTGASDTENSVIDAEKCIGCGACAEACPARAISLVPRVYPPQQPKAAEVAAALRQLVGSKAAQEAMAAALPGPLAEALQKSNRVMAEDLLREAGYMHPQSGEVCALLRGLRALAGEPGFPAGALELLLSTLPFQEVPEEAPTEEAPAEEAQEAAPREVWQCTVCGYIHEGPLPADYRCPVCRQGAAGFVRVEA